MAQPEANAGLTFGLFTTLDNRDHRLPYREVLSNLIEQTRLGEEAGFSTIWTGEHHFGYEGVDIHPNPVITGATLAAHTSTIRIGFAGLIAPQWHPLRMAEDVALLDQLSGGRVECGVGRGVAVREMVNLNVDSDRRNEKRQWALFRETVDIMRKAWTQDPFTYDGLFYRYPQPGTPDHTAAWYPRDARYRTEAGMLAALSVLPKPLQQPHPPVWNVVDSTNGFRIAAEDDMKPMCWLRSTAGVIEAYDAYREVMQRVHARTLARGENCGLLRACFVADTMQQARRITEQPLSFYFGDYVAGHRGKKIFVEPGEEIDNDIAWFDFLFERDQILVGTPEIVAEKITRLREQTGVEHLLTMMALPGVHHSDVMRSIELFGRELMPLLTQADIPLTATA